MAEPFHSDRALQEAYRALMKTSGAGHIDEATWELIASNAMAPSDRDAAFDHVLQCDTCSHVWRGILALRKEAETQGLIAPGGAPPVPLWRSKYVRLAMAATLVVAVAGVMITRQPSLRQDTVRGSTMVASIDGLMMAYDPAGTPTFVWPPFTGAARYRIEVFFEDGRPKWSETATTPPVRWPANTVRDKGAYRWRVDALDGDGDVIARSRLTATEIRR